MKYIFIDAHTGQFQVKRMCRVLGVQRSGYYAWRKRTPSTRAQANQALLALIRAEHAASRKTCQYQHVNVPGIFTHTGPAIFGNTAPLLRGEQVQNREIVKVV